MSDSGNRGVVDYLPLANALWPLSPDELQLLAASETAGPGLRSAAAVTADLKESTGPDHTGQMQQSVLVSLAARLSAIRDLDPEDVAERVRPTLQIVLLKAEAEQHHRAGRRKTLITIAAVVALFLLLAALAAARGIIPDPLGSGAPERGGGWGSARTDETGLPSLSTGASKPVRSPRTEDRITLVEVRQKQPAARPNEPGPAPSSSKRAGIEKKSKKKTKEQGDRSEYAREKGRRSRLRSLERRASERTEESVFGKARSAKRERQKRAGP